MDSFKSILVDIDATVSTHLALDRAVPLARQSGARLTIVDVLTIPSYTRHYLPTDVEEQIVTSRRTDLARIASGFAGIPVESKLLAGRPGTALIEEVISAGHDLVIRSRTRDLIARRDPAVEADLLRECPCPVLLVGPGGPASEPRIVAAVNTSTDDPAEQALNRRIVELAGMVAQLEGGSLTLLHAWVPFGESMIRNVSTGEGFESYVDNARQTVSADFLRLTQSLEQNGVHIRPELRRGEPEDVIPEFAVAEGIDMVVMGTQARRGLARFFVGNTVERVLDRLPCSLLAVKPESFVSTS